MLDRKGQVGLEYLTVLAFLLIVVGVMYAFSLASLNQSIAVSTAENAVRTIVSGAEVVASYGPGNKLVVEADFPNGLSSARVDGNAVIFSVNVGGGTTDIAYKSRASLENKVFSLNGGRHSILVEVVGGKVKFTEI